MRYSHKVCLPHHDEELHGVPAMAKQSRVLVSHWLHGRAVENKALFIIDMHPAALAQPLFSRDPKLAVNQNTDCI